MIKLWFSSGERAIILRLYIFEQSKSLHTCVSILINLLQCGCQNTDVLCNERNCNGKGKHVVTYIIKCLTAW